PEPVGAGFGDLVDSPAERRGLTRGGNRRVAKFPVADLGAPADGDDQSAMEKSGEDDRQEENQGGGADGGDRDSEEFAEHRRGDGAECQPEAEAAHGDGGGDGEGKDEDGDFEG